MTAEHSEPATKAMPMAESVPIFTALALIAAVVLAIACSALFADSDATLRRKVLGSWQTCPKDQACTELIFDADGDMAMRQPPLDFRCTWSIHDGVLTVQLRGGGDMLSSTGVSLLYLFYSSARNGKHLPIRFEGDSVMYIGDEKCIRVGQASQ